MKKIKIISVFVIFILSFISHFMYDIFSNNLFSIIFPVNESIWEHMKLISTPVLIFCIFEYILYKKKDIEFNNFILSYSISIIIGIIFYLIIYLPIHYIFGHSLLVAIIILCTNLYRLIIGVILIVVGMFVGNYVQRNKYEVKEKIKNFVDKM